MNAPVVSVKKKKTNGLTMTFTRSRSWTQCFEFVILHNIKGPRRIDESYTNKEMFSELNCFYNRDLVGAGGCTYLCTRTVA